MDASLTFIGCATTLLRLGPFTLLTDPNFMHEGQRAYLGKGLFSKRLTQPAMQPSDLPSVDAVLLSHLHDDHFDDIAKHRLDRSLPIVTTPHAARELGRTGFERALGLKTWSTYTLEDGDHRLTVTSMPGRHGPGIVDRFLPPVMGSMLDLERNGSRTLRVYITGDTLFGDHLRAIPERFEDVDAMLIHLGGTRIVGILVTMDDRQGCKMVQLIRPKTTVPIHYDDYTVFASPLDDFIERARNEALPTELRPVVRGETIELAAAGRPG